MVELAFTFTGAAGPAGCTYEGPTQLTAGSHASSLTNSSEEHFAMVNIQRLAAGHTHEDFVAYLAEHGDGYPAVPPGTHDNPEVHDWLDGGWRSVHQADPSGSHTVEDLPLTLGEYVAFCWNDAARGPGPRGIWPATPLSVTE